jgi:hypothetical protein
MRRTVIVAGQGEEGYVRQEGRGPRNGFQAGIVFADVNEAWHGHGRQDVFEIRAKGRAHLRCIERFHVLPRKAVRIGPNPGRRRPNAFTIRITPERLRAADD